LLLRSHAKLKNPTGPLSGKKVKDSEEEEERRRKIMPSTMATTFMPAAKGCARTLLGPIYPLTHS
jgi:hypothetical protein